MYRKLLIVLSIIGASFTGMAQRPLQDAQTLSTAIANYKDAGSADILKVVNPYLAKTDQVTSLADLRVILRTLGDSVLLNILPQENIPVVVKVTAVKQAAPPAALTPESGLFSGGAIDALSTFIANRFKQELEIRYLQRFRDSLQHNVVLSTLFPNAVKVLLQNDPTQYTMFFEALKEALEQDIIALPVNIGNLMAEDPLHLAPRVPYYYPSVVVYNNTMKIIKGQSPALVLSALNTDTLLAKCVPPSAYSSTLRLVGVLSRSMQNPDAPDAWLPASTLTDLLKDPVQPDCFVGLLLLKERSELQQNIKFGQTDLYDQINQKAITVGNFLGVLQSVAVLFDAMKDDIAQATRIKTNGLQPTGKYILTYAGDVLNVLSAVDQWTPSKDLHRVVTIGGLLVQGASAAADQNYGLALTQVVAILDTLQVPSTTVALVSTYGNFAVSIAKAKTSADLEGALEAAALPVGSYRIKRNSYRNFSVNAYAGPFGAFQSYPGTVPASVNTNNELLGFTAPVGLAYSWGSWMHGKDGRDSLKGASNTIFLSLIDVGAVTSFRLTHDSTAVLPDLSWSNVFAPAIFYIYGFKGSPVSLGGGVQYGPQLRSIQGNTANILPSAITVRIFCTVDIPVFNLFTRTVPRKNK